MSDVQLTLAVKGNRTVFQEGEIIPLVMSFTSTAKKSYWADTRNYDRSGRLGIESYCMEPEASDPLASYFKFGAFISGGLGSEQELNATPFTLRAELNEWRKPSPGRYRLYVVSYRIWRLRDQNEQAEHERVDEKVRSNAVEFEVRPAAAKWQSAQLQDAIQTLAKASSPEEARAAARKLRFLNTKDSTKQMAKLFWGLNDQQPAGWDLMFGLYGSSYRQLAIDSMRAEFAASGHAITSEFLGTLANLQVTADPAWDTPPSDPSGTEAVLEFMQQRQAHVEELTRAEIQNAIAALPRKSSKARALTLNGILMEGGDDPALAREMRSALVAAWKDLPDSVQWELIEFRWPAIAGPEMLPILRGIAAEPVAPNRGNTSVRDAALLHIMELDPVMGRTLVLRDAQNANATPSLKLIGLLRPEDIALVVPGAVERISRHNARYLDYELLDRYADGTALAIVRSAFEKELGKWACAPQSAMLRYFLRVDPAYGAQQVALSLQARKETHCYSELLQDIGVRLPPAQQSAIEALDDPDLEVERDAALALGRWGTADAEPALWERLRRFNEQWAGHEDQIRATADFQGPGYLRAALEQNLVFAIAGGTGWICPPEKLARLNALTLIKQDREQINNWATEWTTSPAMIIPTWQEQGPTFSVLQYQTLSEDQLAAKLAQFPSGTHFVWPLWHRGHIYPPVSMEKQEELYQRMKVVAEKHGVVLEKSKED